MTRISHDTIEPSFSVTGSPKNLKLRKREEANGPSSKPRVELASREIGKLKCAGTGATPDKMVGFSTNNGFGISPDNKCHIGKSCSKDSSSRNSVTPPKECPKSGVELDKSEELSDIINFLLETDPERSKEAQSSASSSAKDRSASTEAVSLPQRSAEDTGLSRCDDGNKLCQDTASCEGRCSQYARSEPGVIEPADVSPGGIVLPARDIYGFAFEPMLSSQSSISVQEMPKAEAEVTANVLTRTSPTIPPDVDVALEPRMLDAPTKDDCTGSVSEEQSICNPVVSNREPSEDISEPGTTVTLKSLKIMDGTGDSVTDIIQRQLAIGAGDDVSPDRDNPTTSSSATYQDARPPCVKEDSSSDAWRNSGASKDDNLHTAACADVDTGLGAVSQAPGDNEKSASLSVNEREALDTNAARGDQESTCLMSNKTTCADPIENGRHSANQEIAPCKESEVESDDTEALEWAPSSSLTPPSSTDNSRESGFKDGTFAEPDIIGATLNPEKVNRHLPASPKDDSGVPDGKETSDDAADSELISNDSTLTPRSIPSEPHLISVFTKVKEGTIVSVDCRKFRKRKGSRPGPQQDRVQKRRVAEGDRLTNGVFIPNGGRAARDDVEIAVEELLCDMVDKTVKSVGEHSGEGMSTDNLKRLFHTFCETNGYRYQDFMSEEVGISFSLLPGQSSDSLNPAIKKRRRRSSDLGSSSPDRDKASVPQKRRRRKRAVPVPEKRMLTRSQWRRTCYEESLKATRWSSSTEFCSRLSKQRCRRRSVERTAETTSSHTESSVDLPSAETSQETNVDPANDCVATQHDVCGVPEPSASTPVQGDAVNSSGPPKLGFMEASVSSSPSQLSPIREDTSFVFPAEREFLMDDDTSGHDDDRLVICDSEDEMCNRAVPAVRRSESVDSNRVQDCAAERSPVSPVVERTMQDAAPPMVADSRPLPEETSVLGVCESGKESGDTGVGFPLVSPSTETLGATSAAVADGRVATLDAQTTRIMPAPDTRVEDPVRETVSETTAVPVATERPLELVIKTGPTANAADTRGERRPRVVETSDQPLDLSLREPSAWAKPDIPVGKVHPQMASSHVPAKASNSPVNYSSRGDNLDRGVRSPKVPDLKDSVSVEKSKGVYSTSPAEDTSSNSILQRLLLDTNRKPKEPEVESPTPVILDVRSLHSVTDAARDTSKRNHESDIVTEAKSLLSSRLTTKDQPSAVPYPKNSSSVASVPPMSFPENKLGMTTLETKIIELKKQIHHLTILATYKEKELACISSLRTAKEDALKQLENKYPGICSVMRAYGSDSACSESPGLTDVPTIVTQAATATGLSAGGVSETDPPFQKRLAVQQHRVLSSLRVLPQGNEPAGTAPLSYDTGSPTTATQSAFSPRDTKQPVSTGLKSAFCVPGAPSSSQRSQRLLLPKGPVPQNTSTSTISSMSSRTNAVTSTPSSGRLPSWWNNPSVPATVAGDLPPDFGLLQQRDQLREYGTSCSPQYKSISGRSAAPKQHYDTSLHRPAPADHSPKLSARQLPEVSPSTVEESRETSAQAFARHQAELSLSLNAANAASGANAYALSQANLAAANMYSQAMAYSLYQQLRANKEPTTAPDPVASSALLDNIKQGTPSSQKQLYQKSVGPLLEEPKTRPSAWEHLNVLLQNGSADLPSWLQNGLVCINCGDPRVKYVCSCCRTQTFCSEQCQIKLWNKQKSQTAPKH